MGIKMLAALLLWGGRAGAQSGQFTEELARQYPDSAYKLVSRVLEQATRQGDRVAEGTYRQQLGLLFYHQANYSRAIDLLLQAQRLFRSTNQTDRLADNLNELGTTYYYNEQPKLALRQFEEALNLYRRTNNRSGLARTYGNIGHIYEKRQDPKQAYAYQRLALTNYRAANDRRGLATIYENLGSIFEDEARYDSAFFYYRNALTRSGRSRSSTTSATPTAKRAATARGWP